MATVELLTRSATETGDLAAAVGELLAPGDVVVLAGELGAGKTVFAKGVARTLGVTEPVVSPTFTIMREYEGRVPLQHVDVYRLDQVQELLDLGLEEIFNGHAVTLIEWGDVLGALLPADRLEVRLAALSPEEADDDTRLVTIEALGPSWRGRVSRIESAVAPFRES